MKLPAPGRRRRSAPESALPLINVVFLLIVFFLVAGRLAPNAASALADAGTDKPAALRVRVDANNRVRWNEALLDDAAFSARAIDWSQQNPHGDVRVEADTRASADRVVAVFQQLRAAGIANVKLAGRR